MAAVFPRAYAPRVCTTQTLPGRPAYMKPHPIYVGCARLLFTAMLVSIVTACAALNPLAHAVTPEQKYDAALLTYDAVLEPALEVLEDPAAPLELRRSIQTGIAKSGEVYASA